MAIQLNQISSAKQLFFGSGLMPEKDPVFFRIELLMVLLGLLILPVAWLVYRNVPPEIPIYYSYPWGESQLANAISIYWLAGGGIAVTIIHILLAVKLHKRHKFLSQAVLWSGIYILIVAAISVVTIYARVGKSIL
jgi:hypothetical protein